MYSRRRGNKGHCEKKKHRRERDIQEGNGGGNVSLKLNKVSYITETQKEVFQTWGSNLFLYGVAGTGKTYISLYLAFKEVLNLDSPYKKVYIVRSSVPSRDMGFMPGKLKEKMSVYESPYISMVNDLFGRGDAYQIVNVKNLFEVVSTSFLRGITFENCIIIADEVQNASFQELDTLITRVGKNCKVVFCGDLAQNDLVRSKYDQTGLPQFMSIIRSMPSFHFVEFYPEDIVRSGLVREYIIEKLKQERG